MRARGMQALLTALCLLASVSVRAATEAPQAGVTILGDQDSALGLVLAPWKEETAADLDRPPALQDPEPEAVDAEAYARSLRYYQTGRAYRRERLQRNR